MMLASLGLIILFVALLLFVLHIIVCVWVYRDAIRSGKSQEFALIVLVLVFFFPIMGLIIYLIIRNL